MVFQAAVFVLSTSYVAWYFERFETQAIYPFDKTYVTPSDAGAPGLQEERVRMPDGETLVVWHAPPSADRPTILYFSGNAGGLKSRSDRFQSLIGQGFGLVAPAYRGSSGSTGMPDETVIMHDARLLARMYDQQELVLYGESLGTAVAIRLAAEGVGERLVLEAPFTSIPDLILVQHPTEKLDHLITQRWNSRDHVGGVAQPLLIIHGTEDRLVPIAMGEAILESAGSVKKQLLRIENASHTTLWTGGMQAVLFDFLDD